MPEDNVPGGSVPAKTGTPLLEEERIDFFDRMISVAREIVSLGPKFESFFFSAFKIFIIILLAIFILKLIFWANAVDSGIIIKPFGTSGASENLDGYSIAHLLSSELLRIQEIDEKATKVIIFTDFDFEDRKSTKAAASNRGASAASELRQAFPPPEPRPTGDFSFLSQKSESLKSIISSMGTFTASGAQFSPGSFLLFLKEIIGKSPSPITGSIQRYNSTIIMVATLEDHKSNQVFAWEVRRNITRDNGSINEQIPSMIRELSFHIASDLGRRWQPEVYYPESWQALRYQTQAQEAYLNYNRTQNISYLDLASDQAMKAVHSDRSYKKPADMLSDIGFFYLKNNMSNEAERVFGGITHIKPFQGAMGLGMVYSSEGRFEEAVAEFDEAIKLNRSSQAVWYNKANALLSQRRYDEAVKAYDEALKIDPNYAEAWYGKGLILGRQSRYDEAIQVYDEAIKIDSNYADAWFGKGSILGAQGKHDEAILAYDEVLRLDQKNANAWHNKAISLTHLNRIDEAIAAYDEALRLDQKNADAWFNKGNIFMRRGDYDEAIQAYTEVLNLTDFKDKEAWLLKGYSLYEKGNISSESKFYYESIEALNEALKLDPQDALAWELKGEALDNLGDYDGSHFAFKKAELIRREQS